MQAWKEYQEVNKGRFLQELTELLRIPSVSARSEHKPDMQTCAKAVRTALLEAGADKATIFATDGHPIVYAEKIIDPAKPTILVYGHYDVQPADPLELWHSGPFEPVVKDGKLFARGSADDKGQVYMHVKAFETMVKTGTLACNVKFIVEGEEEIGSPNLGKFVESRAALLACDVVLISDTSMLSLDTPSIDVGLRGLTYIEVAVTGPDRDLHSGVYGGAVGNPITTLAEMIASLHDKHGRITIPGFYDDVRELPATERAELARAPFDEAAYKKDLGVKALWGEEGYSTNERTGIRPTLEVNGIWGGYTGEGAKTVLPSKAFAKISCRLVPDQGSAKITKLLIDHLHKIAPPYVTVEAHEHHGGEPYVTPVDSAAFKAASKAMETTFGKTPIPMRGGGSIPITALFERALGVKVVLLGFGLDSDNLHSPNEKFDLANFYKGIETIPYFHRFFAEMHPHG
ncbi:dipeptidase [Dinghuibacter silviterrae]|uniref:Acetylornithine deacetylase/succinyl-diaminopimelate desuccinylase-like protein n=1 Tax=Dinghuibacter silviterrae TaxID=1539049 RepID=A0A4R8DMV5_9BACT|nr:dipeptidase [Dinghuibacter silviterrae]TDW99323.1 acetylornithine deacetylase/succinyl-diaminopimelate desuccinylase-like protein [Dinghuibacter silviterrae]